VTVLRITILGGGLVGRSIAYRLILNGLFDDVIVVDISERNLKAVRKLCGNKIKTVQANVLKRLEDMVSGSDIVSCALPGSISFEVCRRVLGLGISVVDSSYMPQDPFQLDDTARDKGVVYIPDAGFAPGISNIVVGYFLSKSSNLKNIRIYVGGLPTEPVGPFAHLVNWSLLDFIDEYLRPARIIQNGKIISVDPLSDVEIVEIRGTKYEAFYTDGLRTLLKTVRAENMFEKTIRYPGHIERMRFLREIGLLSDITMDLNGARIPARKILENILRRHVYRPDMRDKVVLYIIAEGKEKSFEAYLEEFYDESLGLSAMARTTGFTNAILCEAVIEKIREKGVFPPEYVGMEYMDYFMARIGKHIRITISENNPNLYKDKHKN